MGVERELVRLSAAAVWGLSIANLLCAPTQRGPRSTRKHPATASSHPRCPEGGLALGAEGARSPSHGVIEEPPACAWRSECWCQASGGSADLRSTWLECSPGTVDYPVPSQLDEEIEG